MHSLFVMPWQVKTRGNSWLCSGGQPFIIDNKYYDKVSVHFALTSQDRKDKRQDKTRKDKNGKMILYGDTYM